MPYFAEEPTFRGNNFSQTPEWDNHSGFFFVAAMIAGKKFESGSLIAAWG